MIGLDDEDQFLDVEPAYQPPLAQTASLGLKQSTVCWLPSVVDPLSEGALALAGSWDEPQNELSAWSVLLAAEGEEAMDDGAPTAAAQNVSACAHTGDVLGLSVGLHGGQLVAYTASGAGGIGCFTVDVSSGGVTITPRWADGNRACAPAGGLASLGVCYSAEANSVGTVGEDGVLALLSPERGQCVWRAQSSEPALFDVGWWDRSTCVTAGTSLALWDVRAKATSPQLVLSPLPGAEAHLGAQLLSIATEPQPRARLAAGASDGSIHLWDVRAAAAASSSSVATAGGTGAMGPTGGSAGVAPLHTIAAHSADVWDVQFGIGPQLGQLLSCSADGLLQTWTLDVPSGRAAADLADEGGRPLVELSLPINSLHLSPEGWLASASDAQVLTFMDLRQM